MTERRPSPVPTGCPDRLLVVFVAANEPGARTGNERTLQRLATRLDEAGVDVLVARPGDTAAAVAARVRDDGRTPALVHAFHARRSGPRGAELAGVLGVPLVVGLTGTDLARDIHDAERARVVLDVVRRADAVTCGNADEARTLAELLDDPPPRFVLPKGVVVPEPAPEPTLARGPGEAVVLEVAHVRRVKNVELAIRAVRRLSEEIPVRLVVLGDVLEPEYVPALERAAGGSEEWARILHAAVAPEDVPGVVAGADVVLNTSDGEGGSNAVLEAMALGRTVVASAVPGNVAYVGADGVRGLTYPVRMEPDGSVVHDEDALVATLRRALADPEGRSRMGAEARAWVLREHAPDAERRTLLAAYAVAAPGTLGA